jgi:hypothetical protein
MRNFGGEWRFMMEGLGPDFRGAVEARTRWGSIGPDLCLEIDTYARSGSESGAPLSENLIRFSGGMSDLTVALGMMPGRDRQAAERARQAAFGVPRMVGDALGLTDLYNRLGQLEKRDGIWRPKFNPGDSLIVDSPGADHFKVIDTDTQTAERIEKRQLEVTPNGCTCPMRSLIMRGCPRLRGASACAGPE